MDISKNKFIFTLNLMGYSLATGVSNMYFRIHTKNIEITVDIQCENPVLVIVRIFPNNSNTLNNHMGFDSFQDTLDYIKDLE